MTALGTNQAIGILIFFIFGTIIGGLTSYLGAVSKFPIPYPVLIFFEGLIFAYICQHFDASFVDKVENTTVASSLILYVFLPVLLFGEVKNLNWSHMKGGINQALLLAGPGAILSALVTGGFFEAIWSGKNAWTHDGVINGGYIYYVIGSVLCATDPVSIVSLLKNMGASSELTIVIVGESLLNDGAAMILYGFTKIFVLAPYELTADIFFTFIGQKLIGSPLVGIGIALVGLFVMKILYQDWHVTEMGIQVMITLLVGYSAFFIAQYAELLDGSGVLACCGAGAIFAWLCPPEILSHEVMHTVWEHLEWLCNTLIFLLGGFIAGGRATLNAPGSQYGYLFLFFFLLQFIRVFMVAVCYPFGLQKFKLSELAFVAFSGIRGALAIALALQFKQDFVDTYDGDDQGSANYNEIGDQFYFFVAGVAALSLLFNGSLGEPFVRFLKLVEDPSKPKSPELEIVLRNVKRAIRRQVNEDIEVMESELGLYNSDEVTRLCRLMRDSVGGNDMYQPSQRRISSSMSPDLLGYVRRTFLETVRAHYWECIHNGTIGTQSSAAQLLLYSIDRGLDSCDDPEAELGDWPCLERNLPVNQWVKNAAIFFDNLFLNCNLHLGLVAYIDAMTERRAIYVLTNFIEAHMTAQSKLHIFLGAPEKETGQWLPEEANVMMHSVKSVERAKYLLNLVPSQHLKEFFTFRTARTVLLRQKEIIETMVKEGALSTKWGAAMLATIDDDDVRIDMERQSSHRQLLHELTKQKKTDEMDIRASLRERDSIMSDPERPSISGALSGNSRGTTNRESFSGYDFNDSYVTPDVVPGSRPSFSEKVRRPSFTLRNVPVGPSGSVDPAVSSSAPPTISPIQSMQSGNMY